MSSARHADITTALGLDPEVVAGRAHWWLRDAEPARHRAAVELGLTEVRRVCQLRRPLPAPEPPPITTRTFRRGVDEVAWLTVNASAFADHPDQGACTRADLEERLDAAWFDAEGFLLHDGGPGAIDAFCWTKVHADTTPPMGEIFVIGVDPASHGRGLGRAMTLAGLADLHDRRGMDLAMLFVESDNAPARALYDSLGFTHHHDDVAYDLVDGR